MPNLGLHLGLSLQNCDSYLPHHAHQHQGNFITIEGVYGTNAAHTDLMQIAVVDRREDVYR